MTATMIGLTGPIGAGKTTVAAMLSGLGSVVVDADGIVRELERPGARARADRGDLRADGDRRGRGARPGETGPGGIRGP